MVTFQSQYQVPKTTGFRMVNMNSSSVAAARRSKLSIGDGIVLLLMSICADDLSAPSTETDAQYHIEILEDNILWTVSDQIAADMSTMLQTM